MKRPIMSRTVVTNGPEATAGSRPILCQNNGINAPNIAAKVRLNNIAIISTNPNFILPCQRYTTNASIRPFNIPKIEPIAASLIMF